MRLLIEYYHKNILENMVAALSLSPDVIMFYYDPQYFTHHAVYDTFLVCKKYIPKLKLEVGTYTSINFSEIEDKLQNYISQNNYDEIIVDLTGGNELTAVAAYRCMDKGNISLICADIRNSGIINIIDDHVKYGSLSFEMTDIIEASGGKLMSFTNDVDLLNNRERLLPMAKQILGNVNAWSGTCSYFQKNSNYNRVNNVLHFEGTMDTNPKNQKKLPDEAMMHGLARTRMINHLFMNNDRIEFDFKDRQAMGYLASYGVWLELLTYFAMKDSDRFHDVKNGIKVDWNRNDGYVIVGNEIDVTAMFGWIPVVISCKMSEHATDADALNELYTVSHRMSRGHVIRVLVTYSDIKGRHSGIFLKAREMGIIVMDQSDISRPDFPKRLERAICQNRTIIR